MLFQLFILFLGFASGVLAECTRELLLSAADSYAAAQVVGDTSLLPLSPDVEIIENMSPVELSSSLLSGPVELDLNRSTADAVQCASYTMWISTAAPYVAATQIWYSESEDEGLVITKIDSVVATTGDLFFNAEETLGYIQAQDWSDVPEEDRVDRDELKRVGDAYLDMWTDASAADSITWGSECERVEGSMYTNPCGETLPRGGSATPNGNRRYVIDEVKGSVDVLCTFDSLGDWPDSHEIRVEGGAVRYVHTVTVM